MGGAKTILQRKVFRSIRPIVSKDWRNSRRRAATEIVQRGSRKGVFASKLSHCCAGERANRKVRMQ